MINIKVGNKLDNKLEVVCRRNMNQEAKIIKEWSAVNGIKLFLFDLDDTQCNTSSLFSSRKKEASELLHEKAGESSETWIARINAIDNKGYETHGVAPVRWLSTVSGLIESHVLDPSLAKPLLKIFASIYTTPLSFLDGVEETLDKFKESGVPIATVTHADEAWTWRKYDWLKMSRWYKKNGIYIVDARGHKDAKAWKGATDYYGVKPKESVTAGDSKRSDIKPSRDIGIEHCFLVEGNNWSVQEADIHASVIPIKGIRQIPQILFKQLESVKIGGI